MKKLQCELCGSVDIIKIEDDLFQCQHCGCKYTAEQAKILIRDEVVIQRPDFEIVGGKLIKYQGETSEVIIPKEVTIIGESAFSDCSGITSVVIPEGVRSIESYAFSGCESLIDLVIPDSVNKLGEGAFLNCSGLRSITLSKNIQAIPAYVFLGCWSLTRLDIPEGVVSLKASALPSTLETLTIPYSMKEVVLEPAGEWLNSTKLSMIEGNSKAIFDSLESLPFRFILSSKSLQNIPIIKEYSQIRLRRRVEQKCEYCGGEFKGVFNAVCKKCGRPKAY